CAGTSNYEGFDYW
nr:immunoglobulin heavy chain junction region [Mus musculus]